MRIAVVGAGFAGLATAWHLLKRGSCEVALFDAKGIGAGASGLAAGLMHPYIGEDGKRSMLASEGMEATEELIQAAEEALGERIVNREGIIRHVQNEEQKQLFLSHCEKFKDVRQLSENTFSIESGVTIDCARYLEGLWRAISAKGAKLVLQDVPTLQSLDGFNQIVVAAGAGIAKFPELQSIPYSLIKGQVLVCKTANGVQVPSKSSIGKGYIALSSEKEVCYLGSTYERGMLDETPDAVVAKNALFPKIKLFFPDVENLEIVECRAALRVTNREHYFPIAAKVKEGLWVVTALGSRGLLYHAYLGKCIVEQIEVEACKENFCF